jgi:DnaJ homolog subfamily C member 19
MSMIRAAATRVPNRSLLQGCSSRSSLLLLRQQQQQHQRNGVSASQFIHTHTLGPLDDRRRKEREEERAKLHLSSLAPPSTLSAYGSLQTAHYHTSARAEKGVAIVLGLGAVSALAYAGSSAAKAYNEYKASLPTEEEMEEIRKQQEKESEAERQQREAQEAAKKEQEKKAGKRENIFAKWFGVGVGAKYYEGGFEETMTRREAALILGVRESSPASRIKEAHRKLLVLNHPDTGGSTYVAGKINEAKELLLKGKRGK